MCVCINIHLVESSATYLQHWQCLSVVDGNGKYVSLCLLLTLNSVQHLSTENSPMASSHHTQVQLLRHEEQQEHNCLWKLIFWFLECFRSIKKSDFLWVRLSKKMMAPTLKTSHINHSNHMCPVFCHIFPPSLSLSPSCIVFVYPVSTRLPALQISTANVLLSVSV